MPTGVFPRPSVRDRLLSNITKTPTCWLWIGHVDRHGYGKIYVNGGPRFVHRVSWEMHVGKIKGGLTIDHLCRVHNCVNPAHMELVTRGENVMRGVSVAAMNARKTECLRGHPFSGTNLLLENGGRWRRCRTCRNEKKRRRHA